LNIKIAPSILAADFSSLGNQVQEALDAGADHIHFDVMDGHFVPNLTIGPMIVRALHPIIDGFGKCLDVHLMVEDPDKFIPEFAEAGADYLTVHVETCPHLHRTIQNIKNQGIKAGVTLNPATPLDAIKEILPYVDLVLIMTVNPGFGGQEYIQNSTSKISKLRQMLDMGDLSNVEISADGGIDPTNVGEVVSAGATVIVTGSAIFNKNASVSDNMNAIRSAMERVGN